MKKCLLRRRFSRFTIYLKTFKLKSIKFQSASNNGKIQNSKYKLDRTILM